MKATFFVALAAVVALAPCLPLRAISDASFARTRDWFLLAMLGLGTLLAARYAPPFAPVGLYFCLRWQSHHFLPSLVTWGALAALWSLLATLPAPYWEGIRWGWFAVGVYAACQLVWEYGAADRGHNGRWHPFRYLDTSRAWFGQRTLAAVWMALVLPFYPSWTKVIPVAGLLVTCSWTALLGAAAALTVLYGPWVALPAGVLTALVAAAAVWYPKALWFTPRGNSLDSVRQRLTMSRLLWRGISSRAWWPWGYGPRTMQRAIMVWATELGPAAVTLGNAHMEPGQFVYEYGPLGVVALGVLAWCVVPHLRWGDVWSAAWVAGAVLSLGALPFRAVTTGIPWLAVSVYLTGRA